MVTKATPDSNGLSDEGESGLRHGNSAAAVPVSATGGQKRTCERYESPHPPRITHQHRKSPHKTVACIRNGYMCSGTPHVTLFGLSFVHLAIFSKRRKKANFAKTTGTKKIRTAMIGFHTEKK
jgi:hypothetical protein